MSNKMKEKLIAAIIAILVLLTACAGITATKTKESQLYAQEYRVGTTGLALSFVQNLPPARLFDTDQFTAIMQVENKGAFTVGGPGDKIYLSGFDPTIITGITNWGADIPAVEGKSQFVPTGMIDAVEFKGMVAPLRLKNIDKYPAKLLATACYEYSTVAAANICVDPNPYATGIRKVCTPASVSLGSGQGAPVAVSQIEMDTSPGRIRFKIYVKNVGLGDVFRYGADYLAKCSPFSQPLSFNEIDYVELVDVFISGTSIKPTCKPLDDNHIRLTNGQGLVFCEFMTRGQDAYNTPITVTLRYGYRNTIFKDIQIVSSY
jgi:hypothetical protein